MPPPERCSRSRKMRLRSANPPPTTTTTAFSANLITSLLLSHIQGLQTLKPILKNIYVLICSYLSDEDNQVDCSTNSVENGLKLKLEDTTTLSRTLLNELHRKLLLTADGLSSDQSAELASSEIRDSPEEILLLLRCCCLVVRLHPDDQTVIQRFQDAVALLRRLYSQLISSQSDKSTDSSVRLVRLMLEVYVDEVFAERPFQECLAISTPIFSTWQNQTMCSYVQIKSTLEVIGAHFLLSVSGDHALRTLIGSLIWTEKGMQSPPEVCLAVGLSLIKHPVMMAAPVIIHSHIISLVSEVIGTCFSLQKSALNVRSSKSYLSAFSDAVMLYTAQLSKLITSSGKQLYSPRKVAHRAFKSLFQSEIFDKVNLVLVDMDHSWSAQISKPTSSVITDAMGYLNVMLHIIDEDYSDHVFTLMSSVISKVVSAEINEVLLERFRAVTLQDICLLTSILKLMSCSLLQATSYSKNRLGCLKLFSDSKHMVLDSSSLSGIMSCFATYNLLPTEVQQHIVEGLKPGRSSFDEYKLMFVHFAGLLSLSLITGLDILVKGCLYLMVVLMKIITQKEGCSEVSRSLGSESPAHAFFQANSTSTGVKSTPKKAFGRKQKKIYYMRAALNFQRERSVLLRRQTTLDCSDISDEETCNGEAYLKCFTDNSNDIAELADFIECKPQKDYCSWLLNKGKYRSKRLVKFAKQRRMRMTKAWHSLSHQGRVRM